jgi:hypothetical protein
MLIVWGFAAGRNSPVLSIVVPPAPWQEGYLIEDSVYRLLAT